MSLNDEIPPQDEVIVSPDRVFWVLNLSTTVYAATFVFICFRVIPDIQLFFIEMGRTLSAETQFLLDYYPVTLLFLLWPLWLWTRFYRIKKTRQRLKRLERNFMFLFFATIFLSFVFSVILYQHFFH